MIRWFDSTVPIHPFDVFMMRSFHQFKWHRTVILYKPLVVFYTGCIIICQYHMILRTIWALQLTDGCVVVLHFISAEYLQGIFAKDNFGDTPLDIVHDAKKSLRDEKTQKDKDEYQRQKRKLDVLAIHLRRISVSRYLQQKNTWEKRRDDLFHVNFTIQISLV